MQAIGHGLRFARAVSAAAKAESAEGGTVAARRRGILDDGIWRGARASRREHGTALTQGRETHPTPKRSLPPERPRIFVDNARAENWAERTEAASSS